MGQFLNTMYLNKDGYHLGERPQDSSVIKINANESPYSPSARIGFAVSSSGNIEDLNRMKETFNPDSINSVSQALGCEAMRNIDSMRECVSRIVQTRDQMKKDLPARGFEVLDSHTNFLFFKPPLISAAEFYRELKKDGVLVWHYEQPRIRDYIRMSIGATEQMETVLEKIDRLLAGSTGWETCF
jgi:histidinol-phosphate aminotransferase